MIVFFVVVRRTVIIRLKLVKRPHVVLTLHSIQKSRCFLSYLFLLLCSKLTFLFCIFRMIVCFWVIFYIYLMFLLLFLKIIDIDVDRSHPILRRRCRPRTSKPIINWILLFGMYLVISEGKRSYSFT